MDNLVVGHIGFSNRNSLPDGIIHKTIKEEIEKVTEISKTFKKEFIGWYALPYCEDGNLKLEHPSLYETKELTGKSRGIIEHHTLLKDFLQEFDGKKIKITIEVIKE